MTSKIYNIARWDAIINDSKSNAPVPGIYVIPDSDLINLCQQKNKIAIKIVDTQSSYDQKLAYAIVQPSEYTGGYRPNFQYQTGSVVILPDIKWDGYPRQLGSIEVLDFVEEKDNEKEMYQSIAIETRKNILKICCCCTLILILLYIIWFR